MQIFPQTIKYTNTEKEIIHYIEQNLNNIDNLTITDLAKRSHTSNSSIIRLSRKVNCDGFKSLKVKIIKERENSYYLNNNINFSFPFLPVDDPETIKNSITNLYLNSLTILREQVSVSKIIKTVDMIINSENIFMFGIGDTGITVKSFINKVNKLGIYPIFANENGEAENMARRLKPNDTVIFTSYSGYEHEFGNEIVEAHKNCKTILITAKPETIYKDKIDLIIPIPNEEKEKKVTTFFSQFAFQYVFNLIFAFLYKDTML